MFPGDDVPGRITRRPGGVALNVAAALARRGLRPGLLGAVGGDAEGAALIDICRALGIDVGHLYRSPNRPTDIYMAIEADHGVVAAIADAAGLEAAGNTILAPLTEGPLGTAEAPYTGIIAIDGNLTCALLTELATHPAFAAADLRIAPASPGKADRIARLARHPRATLYINRAEAGLIAGRVFPDAATAADGLLQAGVPRALVTDGEKAAVFAWSGGHVAARPAPVTVAHVTGAGDALMATHIAEEMAGATPRTALEAALRAAADHISAAPVA